MKETEQLANYVADLRFEDLPPEVVAMAKTAIRDALGVAMFAGDLEWTRLVRDYVEDTGSTGGATIWGSTRQCAPAHAAMVNGTAVHGIEMDDRSTLLDIHNGAVTIPAAIALAEHQKRSGRELIVAVVCGYEAAYRVARATLNAIWPRFYAPSIRSSFGSTSAAAKLLGLRAEQIQWAYGIVGTMATGNMEFTQDPHGTMSKRLQGGGWPSHNGVTAAMLASRGFTGPRTVLEGVHGIIKSFCVLRDPIIDELTKNLGKTFEIMVWQPKPYSSWGNSHSSIDAALFLMKEHGITAEAIESVEVACSTKVSHHTVAERGLPASVMAAQHNLSTIVAAAFCGYNLGDPNIWTETLLHDERVRDLSPRVTTIVDPAIEKIYDETNDHGGIVMDLKLRDGRTFTHHVRYSTGSLENPMPEEALREKFRRLAGKRLSAAQVRGLEAFVDGLDANPAPVDLRPFAAA